jgi:hypothetical protein
MQMLFAPHLLLDPFFGVAALISAELGGSTGATAGAWMIDAIYALSIGLTAVVTLPELRRRANLTPDPSP